MNIKIKQKETKKSKFLCHGVVLIYTALTIIFILIVIFTFQ